jgi:putative ABC transport system substrate-binding protein
MPLSQISCRCMLETCAPVRPNRYASLAAVRRWPGQWAELLKEVVPELARTAVLWNGANPANALAWRETEGAARALGVTLQSHDVRSAKDFEIAFAAIAQQRPDALSVLTDALITQYQKEIVDFAIHRRLPSVFPNKEPIEAGGLMSYGPHFSEMMRRAASQVDKILRGTQPADIPMEQPTTFELVINLSADFRI